jgi:predicted phage tail protein
VATAAILERLIRVKTHNGSSDQTADSDLVSESAKWTSNHRLRGIAYMYVRLKFDADAFPNGIPVITATVKGKKLYDPRTSSTAWSDNPALCLRDYLTSKYGLAEDEYNIDDTLVISSANVCDQTNTLASTTRYTCNGAFTTASTPYDMLSEILKSMGGSMWYAQGKWRMKPAYWTAPVMDLSEDMSSKVLLEVRKVIGKQQITHK